jgi:glycosyltransferase involved in cell wall biosynthesis
VPEGVEIHAGLRPGDALVRDLYARCDVFVLPTTADMSSWAALEAMATGRPVIVSGVGGIPELIEDGVTGFLISPGDRKTLAARLRILLDNGDLRREMGHAGRRRVERNFDARVSVPIILGLMKRTVDRARAARADCGATGEGGVLASSSTSGNRRQT